MLMNCARLRLWTKEVVETQSGAYPPSFPGDRRRADRRLPKTWNTLDWMDETPS